MFSSGLTLESNDITPICRLPCRKALLTRRVRVTDRKLDARKLQPRFCQAVKRVDLLENFTGGNVRSAEIIFPYLRSINDVFNQGSVSFLEPHAHQRSYS